MRRIERRRSGESSVEQDGEGGGQRHEGGEMSPGGVKSARGKGRIAARVEYKAFEPSQL